MPEQEEAWDGTCPECHAPGQMVAVAASTYRSTAATGPGYEVSFTPPDPALFDVFECSVEACGRQVAVAKPSA